MSKKKSSSLTIKSKKDKVFDDYNHVASFDKPLEELNEFFIEKTLSQRHVGVEYMTKTTKAGNQFEVEIYPFWRNKKKVPKGIIKKGETPENQRNLNDKNSRRRLIRLVHNNFGVGDYWITFTFREEDLPNGFSELRKILKNYFARLNRLRKKKGLENARYIYVVEEGTYGTKRFHIHLIMDHDLSKEEVVSKWKHGDVDIRKINYYGDQSMIGLCKYIVKDPETYKKTAFRIKGKREWGSSKGNLKLPIPKKNKTKFRKNKVNYMAMNHNSVEEIMEMTYPNYYFKEAELRYNEENGLFYIYVLMHDKRNIKSRR